jgi:hypothetical protein
MENHAVTLAAPRRSEADVPIGGGNWNAAEIVTAAIILVVTLVALVGSVAQLASGRAKNKNVS